MESPTFLSASYSCSSIKLNKPAIVQGMSMPVIVHIWARAFHAQYERFLTWLRGNMTIFGISWACCKCSYCYTTMLQTSLIVCIIVAGSSYDATDDMSVIYNYDLDMYYCYLDVWISFYKQYYVFFWLWYDARICQYQRPYILVTFPWENISVFSLEIPTPECGKGAFAIVRLAQCFDVYRKATALVDYVHCYSILSLFLIQQSVCWECLVHDIPSAGFYSMVQNEI